jgi:hypothetical protein
MATALAKSMTLPAAHRDQHIHIGGAGRLQRRAHRVERGLTGDGAGLDRQRAQGRGHAVGPGAADQQRSMAQRG